MNPEQGTDQWLEQRLGCITGSDAWRVMSKGETRKTYIYQIVSEIMTAQTYALETAAMRHGKRHEAEARLLYEIRTGNVVEQCGFIKSQQDMRLGCSPDGEVGLDKLIEIKCPYNSTNHVRYMFRGPDKTAKWQIQFNLFVTGRSSCDFISYDPRFPPGSDLHVQSIVAEPAMHEMIQEACDEAFVEIDNIVADIMVIQDEADLQDQPEDEPGGDSLFGLLGAIADDGNDF